MRDPKVRYAALVFGLSLILGGCSLTKYFQSSTAPDDNAITSQIQAKLFQDPALKAENIRVISQKGVVVLTGSVGNAAEKSSAEQLASGVTGVKQVINELTVGSASTASAAAKREPAPTPEPPPERPRPKASHHRRSQETAKANAPAPPPAPAESQPSAAPAQPQAAAQPAPEPPPAPPAPVDVTVPAGTVITIRTIDTIDTSKVQAGQEFSASIASPVAENGSVVIPQGADARLRVESVASAGHIKGQSELRLQLVSLSVGGASYPVASTMYSKTGSSRTKRSAETIGGGAGLGALIGAIVGHGKGAAIGAAIGAGAGTAAQAATKGQQVVIPPETKIDFTLTNSVTIPVQP